MLLLFLHLTYPISSSTNKNIFDSTLMYKNYLSIIIGKVISLFKMTGRINNLPLYVHFHNADYKYENLLDIVLLNYRSLHQYLSSASLLYVFEFLFSLICTSSKRCRKFSFSIFICWFSSSNSARCCFNSPNCLYKCPICSSILETDAKISFSPQAPTSLICGLTRNDPFIH